MLPMWAEGLDLETGLVLRSKERRSGTMLEAFFAEIGAGSFHRVQMASIEIWSGVCRWPTMARGRQIYWCKWLHAMMGASGKKCESVAHSSYSTVLLEKLCPELCSCRTRPSGFSAQMMCWHVPPRMAGCVASIARSLECSW